MRIEDRHRQIVEQVRGAGRVLVTELAESGWRAQIGLEDGLRSTIDWFHANADSIRQ